MFFCLLSNLSALFQPESRQAGYCSPFSYLVLPPHLRLFAEKTMAFLLVGGPNIRGIEPFPAGVQARKGPAWEPSDSRALGEGKTGRLSRHPILTQTPPHFRAILSCLPRRAWDTDLHSCCLWWGNTQGSTSLLRLSQSTQSCPLWLLSESWVREASDPYYLADGKRWH